jgi:hypothetical protein
MDRIARLSNGDRRDLFFETADRKGTTPAVVEKDFWVSLVLKHLFSEERFKRQLLFKGGTSLSKVYGLIERFSEDIDLVLNWDGLIDKDPFGKRSRKQQDRLVAEMLEGADVYVADTILPFLSESLGEFCGCSLNPGDPRKIDVVYPESFPSSYLRPGVVLEIGPRSAWLPNEIHEIRPYTADYFPELFDDPVFEVTATTATRTFWEKVVILHQEAHRAEGTRLPDRQSRHYYDVHMMCLSEVKLFALEELALLEKVVDFSQRFFPRAWARFDLACPGTLRLEPPRHVEAALRADYSDMREMIYGNYPDFDEVMRSIRALQKEVNQVE